MLLPWLAMVDTAVAAATDGRGVSVVGRATGSSACGPTGPASDDAAFITGQVFVIDGGEIAGGLASQV